VSRSPLVSFADAGGDGSSYRVWLPLPRATASANLLLEGEETRSRLGNVPGSIIDDNLQTYVVTFDGQSAAEDWFAVSLDGPARNISRVVYAHGQTFHDGGWFDTDGGKPRVQVQSEPNGPWQTVGELSTYPATTATNAAGLKNGESFTLSLSSPVKVVGIRVIGKPACGDNRQQAFSSCAELQAFEK
jgi:uncharacterized protein